MTRHGGGAGRGTLGRRPARPEAGERCGAPGVGGLARREAEARAGGFARGGGGAASRGLGGLLFGQQLWRLGGGLRGLRNRWVCAHARMRRGRARGGEAARGRQSL